MLLVHSRSTERYAEDWEYDWKFLVTQPPTEETLELEKENSIIAIGGGSVIDTAKILSKNPIIAVPTTYSGASRTSHAVYWENGRKLNLNTEKPITIIRSEYLGTLPEEIAQYSQADCICHILESLTSRKSTPASIFYASQALDLIKKGNWIDASLLAGDAIEITGTNIIHALSYALTAIYKIPHAKALAYLLPKFPSFLRNAGISIDLGVKLDVDASRVVNEALTYSKIYDYQKPVSREMLEELLK